MPSMNRLNDRFQTLMAPFAGKRFLLACSGGLDSMVLAELAHRNALEIELAHVNYGLRGTDSEEDEVSVRHFAEKKGIPFHIKKTNASELKGNLQAAARDIRYRWFEDLRKERALDFVLLAHHCDDQIETFFLNLGRSSGFMGLSCMPFQRDHTLRPLLEHNKDALLEFASREGIHWREDISNSSLKYARNRLRHEFLPLLYAHVPDLKESVLLLIQHFQKAQNALETELRSVYDAWHTTRRLEISQWQAFNEHEKVELLRQIGQPASLMKHLDQLTMAEKGSSLPLSRHSDFPYHALVRERSHFLLTEENTVPDGFHLHIDRVESLPDSFDKESIYLNEEKILGKLQLRTWQQGDRIASVGMQGSQLISDIISDAAIPSDQKNQVLVLHDDAHIHWCPGLKIGRMALATGEQPSGILRCTISKVTAQESDDLSGHLGSED